MWHRRTLHHSQPSRVHTKSLGLRRFLGLRLFLFVHLLARLGFLLLLALSLLHGDFGFLDAIASTLVVQFFILGCDLGLSGFAVATAPGTVKRVSSLY